MPRDFSEENQREFRRIDIELKASYRVQDIEINEGWAEIQNLGHGGLMFIASSPINKGDLVYMTVYFNESEIPVHAKIVWSKELSGTLPQEFKYGAEYTKIASLEQSYLSLIIGSNHQTN
jgi:hypothetical protein